ncbi:MAG: putative O-methyltransferase [Chlamydiae bacterium]|nr:putative O-methyltransferase [Chlamydiota bacterium]
MLPAELNNYLIKHSHPLSNNLNQIVEDTIQSTKANHMISGPLVSALLRLLVRLTHPKLIVDLGTFTGFSALSMAEVMPKGCHLISCEINSEHCKTAKSNFNLHPTKDQITLFEGCVQDCLEKIDDASIDLAFLDANKTTYFEYYESLVHKLKSGGILVMDDILWKGHAISPYKNREKRMDEMNHIISNDQRVENLLLPIRNGVNVIYKL